MADKIKFWPIRGTYDQIIAQPYYDGKIYFAYDTNQIILDVNGSKHIMGGGGATGSGIVYANGTEEQIIKVTENIDDFNYKISLDALENSAVEPQKDALILNSDGRFFRVLSVDSTNRIINAILLAVSGTGGGTIITDPDIKISVDDTTLKTNDVLVQGKEHYVTVIADAETSRYVSLTFNFTGANGYTESFIETAISGEAFNFDLSFLPLNSSISMTVIAKADNSNMPNGVSWTISGIKVVEMGIEKISSTSYNPVITSEDLMGLSLSFIPKGDSSITETLHVFIDGEEVPELQKTLNSSYYGSSTSISIPTQSHGTHKVALSVSTVLNRQELFSDQIEYEVAWAEDDNDTPIIWLGDYDELIVNYENASIPFMVFNPEDYRNNRPSTVRLFKDGLQISEIEVPYSKTGWAYWDISAIYEVGSNLFAIQQGISSKEFSIEVTTKGSRELGLVNENTLLLNYSSAGRSPSELKSARNTWKSTGIQKTNAIMSGFNWANNGWISPAPSSSDYNNGAYLSIANGASLEIPMSSYSLNNAQDYSFEIRFRVRNVQQYSTLVTTIPTYFYKELVDGVWIEHKNEDDGVTMDVINNSDGTMEVLYDPYGSPWANDNKTIQTTNIEHGIVCKWIDPSTQNGFVIGTQEAFFQSPAKLVSVRYKEDEVINISFVVSVAEHLAYIYLNGIPSGATELPVDAQGNPEPFIINTNMTFNSNYCDFDLYRVRVYQYGLTIPNVIHNYLSDIHSIALYDQNQLTLATNASQLDYNLLAKYNEDHPEAPTMPYATWKITKNDEFGRETLPYYKGDERKATINFVNPPLDRALEKGDITPYFYYTHSPSFIAEGVDINVQGTSSQGYPRRNYKTKYKKATSWVFTFGPLKDLSLAEDHYFTTSGQWIGAEAEAQGEEESKDEYKVRMKQYIKLGKKFHMDTESVSTNKFTWKIDYMESSGMYNTGFANLMGNLQHPLYLKHPLEDLGIDATDMRTSVYGYPVLTFHEFADGSYEYIGRYNMNLDKSSNEYFGFEDENVQPFMNGETINNIAECWEMKDNQGSWCSFKFPNAEAREVGFGYTQAGYTDRLEMMQHFEYRYSAYGDQLDAIGADGKYDGATTDAEINAEIGSSNAEKSHYVRNKYYNFERLFYWLDSTDTSAATNEDIIIREPILNEDGTVTIQKTVKEYVEYPTAINYTGINGATSTPNGSTYITRFTKDSVGYRQEKFRNEFEKHYDKHYCIIYFIMTELLLCYDSRGKNMMTATWGPHEEGGEYIWYPIFYDVDTQLGLNNSGAYLWDYDADVTMDGLFSTPSSVLWTNLYNLFLDDIKKTYRVLRGLNDDSKIVNSLTYTNIVGAYECNASVFNSYAMGGLRPIVAIGLDEYYKYFATTTASGIGYYDTKGNLVKESTPSYAYCCQGDKKLNTELLLRNRLNYIDSWWMGGDYQIEKVKSSEMWLRVSGNRASETSDKFLNLSTEEIEAKRIPADDTPEAATAAAKYNNFSHGDYPVNYLDSIPGFKIKPFLKQYVSFYTDEVAGQTAKFNDGEDEQDGIWTPVSDSVVATYRNDPESPNSQLCYIPGTDYISSLGDLSLSYIDEFHLNRGIRLLDLNLGSDYPGYYNTLIVPSKFELKDSVGDMETNIHKPLLKKVLLNHLQSLSTSIDLSASAKLQEFRALDTPITGAKFALGAPLHTVHLPNTVNSLSLIEASDLDTILTTAPVVATVNAGTGKLEYNDASTYRGLYIQGVTDTNTSGTGCNLNTLTIQGGHLKYGSYQLLKRLVDLKSGAIAGNSLAANLTEVEWTPFEVVSYGEAQGAGPYYQLTDHSTFEEYTGTSVSDWNNLTLNEKIYTRDNTLASSTITNLDILDTFMADYNRAAGQTQQFTNTTGSTNRTVPSLTGNMYVENTEENPIDEAELTNVYRALWPDLIIRAAYIAESYIAKYVQVLDSGKEEEIDIIRYTKSGTPAATLTNKTPSKQYHDFKGWSLVKGSTVADFATYDENSKTCTIINPQLFNEDRTVITLYAVFENHPYNVIFYNVDGVTEIARTYATYGEKAILPNILPTTNESELELTETYKFVGYSRTIILPSQVTDYVLQQNIVNVENVNVTKDLAFYAVYRKQSVYDEVTDLNYFDFGTSTITYIDKDRVSEAYGDDNYNITGYMISIKKDIQLKGKITLPSYYNGLPVIAIGPTFGKSPNATSAVGWPGGGAEITHIFWKTSESEPCKLRYISSYAFAGTTSAPTSLQYIELPEGLRHIDGSAFFCVKHLKTITPIVNGNIEENSIILPSTLRYIGTNAFNGAFVESATINRIVIPPEVARLGNRSFGNIDAIVPLIEMGTQEQGSSLAQIDDGILANGDRPGNPIFSYTTRGSIESFVFYYKSATIRNAVQEIVDLNYIKANNINFVPANDLV